MKKINLFFYLLLCISLYSCTHTVYSYLSWQDTPVVVDGNMNEWPNPLRFYDSKSKINYSITNDRKKIFICLKISDEVTQFRILEGGMEFSIDTADKKTYPIKLIYPPGSNGQGTDDTKKQKKEINMINVQDAKRNFLGLLKEIEVKGFKYPVTSRFASNNPFGISVSVNWDKTGIMVYEAVIPFATFYKEELFSADTNKVISLKFLLNALPVSEEMKKNKTTQDDSNITGRGSMSDGLNSSIYGTGPVGYGTGTTQNTGTVTSPLYEPLEFKLKVKLSFQ